MNHSEAIETMAAERYLLNELTSDVREAFENHAFECADCAIDLRAGAVFVNEAKIQLAALDTSSKQSSVTKAREKRSLWSSWWRPAFVAPAFALMLIVLGYQNFVTLPQLRESAIQPRLAPLVPLHSATRGASHLTFTADRTHGVALPVDLYVEAGAAPAVSYTFDLRDPQQKLIWTGKLPAPAQESGSSQPFSLLLPGGVLQNGSYSLTVTSVTAQGTPTVVDRYNFDIVVPN